jgi:acyl-CoA thioester hydrolase
MPRIKIDLPENFGFSTNIPVRISDVNCAGHVGWNYMFSILEEANVRFWKSLNLWQNPGEKVPRITVDAGINYKKQSFHGQTLKVEMAVTEMTVKGFNLVYRVSDAENGDEIARAKAGLLCYDYDNQKVVPIPDNLKLKLSEVSGN